MLEGEASRFDMVEKPSSFEWIDGSLHAGPFLGGDDVQCAAGRLGFKAGSRTLKSR